VSLKIEPQPERTSDYVRLHDFLHIDQQFERVCLVLILLFSYVSLFFITMSIDDCIHHLYVSITMVVLAVKLNSLRAVGEAGAL